MAFDKKLQKKNRKELLFLDNFSCHVLGVETASQNEGLQNLRVEWLPPNCTSLVQPVDIGFGNTFKQRYRAFVHTHMANMVFHDKPARMGIDHMRVCAWLGREWNSLNNTKAVRLCFAKAGFLIPNM